MRWRPLPAFAAIDFLSCMLVVFVAVALTSAPPQVKTYGATRLAHQGDERTAFRFTIDHTGRLSGISHVPVSLASSTTTFASG
jgi:hypothetical protein